MNETEDIPPEERTIIIIDQIGEIITEGLGNNIIITGIIINNNNNIIIIIINCY